MSARLVPDHSGRGERSLPRRYGGRVVGRGEQLLRRDVLRLDLL